MITEQVNCEHDARSREFESRKEKKIRKICINELMSMFNLFFFFQSTTRTSCNDKNNRN